jgi:hypothetical protein
MHLHIIGPIPYKSLFKSSFYSLMALFELHIASNVINEELERRWKEPAVSYFKVLYQDLSRGAEENHKKISHHSMFSSQDSKRIV